MAKITHYSALKCFVFHSTWFWISIRLGLQMMRLGSKEDCIWGRTMV